MTEEETLEALLDAKFEQNKIELLDDLFNEALFSIEDAKRKNNRE